MSRGINILIISKDSTLLDHEAIIGDTRKRHITYANILRSKYPGSRIKIITYTKRSSPKELEYISEGISIYGTNSIHRITFIFGIIKLLPIVLREKWQPNIVTVQTPWEEGVIGYVLSKSLKAKFIPQIHFDLFSDYWLQENRLNYCRKYIAFMLLIRSDAIRVVSELQKEKLVCELGVTENKIRVIPVGVNFQPVHGGKSEYKEGISPLLIDTKVVLFVGRFYAPKNLHLWVETAEIINRRLNNVMFVMVGNGPMYLDVKEAVINRNLTSKFLFLGYIKHGDLPKVYAASDVFLLTSKYEGFGRVVLEAYMASIPVVSTMCAGTLDLIESGKTGILSHFNDAESLAKSVVRLLEDDQLRVQYGEKGREKVLKEYDNYKLASDLVDFWSCQI